MNTPPPIPTIDDNVRALAAPRRNSLTSLDPWQTKRQRRMAVVVTVDDDDGPDSPKNLLAHLSVSAPPIDPEEKTKRVSLLLKKHPLFARLSPELRTRIFREFALEEYKRGESIFTYKVPNDKFYVIEKGFCCAEGADPLQDHSGAGSTFGDISLVQLDHKKFNLGALCDVSVWSIDGSMVRFMISAHQLSQFQTIKSFFEQYGARYGITSGAELNVLLDASSVLELKRGDPVPHHGQNDYAYLVKEGEIEVNYTAPPLNLPVKRLANAMEFFGIERLLSGLNTDTNMRAICIADPCTVFCIKLVAFQRLPMLKAAVFDFANLSR